MNDTNIQIRLKNLAPLVGNTPLLEIDCLYKQQPRRVYAKAENLNMTGSIKDRMAIHILKKAYSENTFVAGSTIIEASSGNSGISFAAIGRALGSPVVIFMPDWMSKERKKLICSFGASIRMVSKAQGGFLGSIRMAQQLAHDLEHSFLPSQFSNQDNCEAHFLSTGPEIAMQLESLGLAPHAFVAGVGTGGTVMGIGNYLRKKYPGIKIHPLESANSPTLSTGYKVGKHRIQGISDEFIPAIVQLQALDDVICVEDGDAIIMAQKLSATLGLSVGISSGANFLAALKLQNEMGEKAVVATVFADDNKKYLSTDLMKTETIKPEFLSPDVTLLGVKAIKGSCNLCASADV